MIDCRLKHLKSIITNASPHEYWTVLRNQGIEITGWMGVTYPQIIHSLANCLLP